MMSDAAKPHSYEQSGRCIYCGTPSYSESRSRLGDEHVVPQGLGGQLILPRASCRACEVHINGFEQFCQKDMLAAFRYHHGLPTKRPKERPKTLPAEIENNGEYEPCNLPIAEYPLRIAIPILPTPEILRPVARRKSPIVAMHMFPGPADFSDEFYYKGNMQFMRIKRGKFRVVSGRTDFSKFAGMLAKIGHSFAVGELGASGFEPMIYDGMQGRTPFDLHHLVGGETVVPAPTMERHTLSLNLESHNGQNLWVAKIRLFGDLGWPQYTVVVGAEKGRGKRLTRHMVSPTALALKRSWGMGRPDNPFKMGSGTTDWICSGCDEVLISGSEVPGNWAIKCARCGAKSRIFIDDNQWVLPYVETSMALFKPEDLENDWPE